MKKIFTSFLFAACALIGLNAQSFEFRMNGEKVAEGSFNTDEFFDAAVKRALGE